jgi:cbb3-type cytochrome oxidase subunit 3
LPNGNLLWKLIALLLVFFGFLWILYSIEHSKCKIKQ